MRIAIALSVLIILSVCAEARVDVNQEAVINLQRQATIAAQAGEYNSSANFLKRELKLLLAQKQMTAAATAYIDLAELGHVQGFFPAAEANYKKGIELLERYGAVNDTRLVRALDGLGWMDVTWGRRQDAARFMEEARVMSERAKLDAAGQIKHLDTQAAYLVVLGRYSEAQKEFMRALNTGRAAFGNSESQYDYVLLHFGQASVLYHDYVAASRMFQRFLQAEGRGSRAQTVTRGVAEAELAHVYVETHKIAAALPLFQRSLADFNGRDTQVPLVYSMVLGYLGDYYMAEKHWSTAALEYRQALKIRLKVAGHSRSVATCMLKLSTALQKMHHKHEAKELVAQARGILSEEPNVPNDTVDVLELQHR